MNRKWFPWITGIAATILFVGALLLHTMAQPPKAEPLRQADAPVAEPLQPRTTPNAPSIPVSDIVTVQLPAVDIDVKASGETWPRKSKRCRGGGSECIDPPIFTEVAWYGAYARPSLPSKDSVLLFGHTNWYDQENQAFNNLPATKVDDRIIVTTKTGVFTYLVNTVDLVRYDKVPYSKLIFGHRANKIVLVTCNDEEDSATVVTAMLKSAQPL